MKPRNYHLMLAACVVTMFVDCTCSNSNSDTANTFGYSRSLKNGAAADDVDEQNIQQIPVTKKILYNGDEFWYGGTCREISEKGLEVCTNKHRNEQNDFIFMSAASITNVVTVIDHNYDYYSFTANAPNKWVQEMSAPKSDNRWVISAFVYDEDSWIIVYSDQSYKQKGCPEPVVDCISEICADEQINGISFNSHGNWVVTTIEDNVYADEETGAFIERAFSEMPQVEFQYFQVSEKGRIATSFDGIYFENIPANLARKIQEVEYASAIAAFNDAGEYLLGGNGSDHYDACFTSQHISELKENLSKFHIIEGGSNSVSPSTTSSSSSSVSAPIVQPYPCGICSGTRRCTSCSGKGYYYAHDIYHQCGVCNGSGICTGCNGTGIQTY